jgi:hypothetical protein
LPGPLFRAVPLILLYEYFYLLSQAGVQGITLRKIGKNNNEKCKRGVTYVSDKFYR